MRRFAAAAWRLLKALPLAVAAPALLAISAIGLLLADVLAALRGRGPFANSARPDADAASIVIPNWNGRDLLE